MAPTLADITTGRVVQPPKIALHGVPGIGKTTFAAGAPSPIFIQTEDGLGLLDAARFPVANSYDEVTGAIASLYKEDHGYKTVVLDSLDRLEPLIWDKTAKRHKKESIEDFGYGKGYVLALQQWWEVLSGLHALRTERGMAVILIAHSEIKRYDAPDTESYDRFVMRLQPRASGVVSDWVDCLLFANYRVAIKKTTGSYGREAVRGVGKGERILYTE